MYIAKSAPVFDKVWNWPRKICLPLTIPGIHQFQESSIEAITSFMRIFVSIDSLNEFCSAFVVILSVSF